MSVLKHRSAIKFALFLAEGEKRLNYVVFKYGTM